MGSRGHWVAAVLLILLLGGAVAILWSGAGDPQDPAPLTSRTPDIEEEEKKPVELTATAEGPELAAHGSEPRPRKAPAHEGEFKFHYKQGYSFLKREVVEADKAKSADLVFSSCAGGISSVTLSAPGGAITNLSAVRSHIPEVVSSAVLCSALVRAHPNDLRLRDRTNGNRSQPHTDASLLRTRRGEWVKLALIHRGHEGGWTDHLITITYTLVPGPPVFEDVEGVVYAGFELDIAGLRRRTAEAKEEVRIQAEAAKREQEIRARPVRQRLADLDRRAKALEATFQAREEAGANVAAVATNAFARPLGKQAYAASTYSFEKATRDDAEATRNDWDFAVWVQNGQLAVDVTTVTDDRSLIRDLGAIDFETARRGDVGPGEGAEQVPAVEGHLYLIHTLDSESDYWVLMQILEIHGEETVIFRWEMLEDPGPLRSALIPDTKSLRAPEARLQIRGGAGGGNPNRAFLDGTTNAYVDKLVDAPLDFKKPLSSSERCHAYVEGGYVPRGQVFLVQTIEYTARADGDSNGPGEFILRVGDFRIAHLERNRTKRGKETEFLLRTIDRGTKRIGLEDFPVRRTLSVRIPIGRDAEKNVFAEIANSSFADVVLRGVFVPVAEMPKSALSLLEGMNYRTVQWTLRNLAEHEDGEAAVTYFDHLGPKIIPWLEAVSTFGADGEYRRRLDAALERLRR